MYEVPMFALSVKDRDVDTSQTRERWDAKENSAEAGFSAAPLTAIFKLGACERNPDRRGRGPSRRSWRIREPVMQFQQSY